MKARRVSEGEKTEMQMQMEQKLAKEAKKILSISPLLTLLPSVEICLIHFGTRASRGIREKLRVSGFSFFVTFVSSC